MKKLTYFFNLCLLTAMMCVFSTKALGAVTYSLNTTTKTLTFSGTGEMDDYTDPDGSGSPRRPATWVFNVQTVIIEEGVTSIGEWVFAGLTNFKYVYIPTSVTTISERAFSGCTVLEAIYYAGTPDQWAQIDFEVTGSYCYSHPFCATTASAHKYYFYNQTTTETVDLTFTNSINQIKKYAFYRANDIADVYIPGTVTSIGDHALDCSIKRLYINKSVAPTASSNAISWLTSGTYIYMRSDATNSYNKQPWINTTSSTTTGAKNLGYTDYSTTRVSCSWKTSGSTYLYLHKVSGTINSTINWSLSEDGTLTFSGSGTIATTFNTTYNSANVLPWYRFRRLVNKVVIKSNGNPITGISNAINWCLTLKDITIAQTYVPTPTMTYLLNNSNFAQYRMSSDKINVYGDTSSEEDDTWDGTPWNDSKINVSFTTTFCGDPSALNISNIGTTTATASWTDDKGDSWKYICQPSASAAPTSSDWASATTTTSKSVNLTGLTQGTSYKFYLISDCGSVGTSDVISSSVFSTDCEIISSLPWNEGFESSTNNALPLCWKQITNNNSKVYAYNSADNAHSNNFSMVLYGGGSNRTITAIFPEFEDDIKDLALSFWYKTSVTDGDYTYGQPQLGYITDPEDDDTFRAVGDALDQTGSYVQIENFTVPANTPNGAFFAIRYSGGLDNTGYAYIDDITVTEKPSCNKPTGVSAGSVTDEGATISWNANDMSAWKLQVSEGDAASWGSDISVATNSKVLTGLKAHTLYYVRVKADCGGDVSDWSDNVSFTTLCGTISVSASSSWNVDFEGLSDHVIPECWDNTASTTTSSWGSGYIWGTFERSSNKSLAMDNSVCDGGTALINTPDIAIPNDGREYELTFDYSNMASENNLSVKISANGGAFVEKGTYYPSGNVSSYPGAFSNAIISLADYSGQTIKIQFFANPTSGTASGGGAMFVDNVSVHKVPTCFAPTDLAFGNLTANSARATWTAGGSETAWRLQYRADGGSWSAEQTVNTTAHFDITGLNANTLYYVRVKAYCDVTDQSDWSEEGSFTTLCAAESMPFNEAFSSYTALPSCWQATPADGTYRWRAYENSGAYSVQLRTGSSGEAELRMPAISLSEDAILRFEWKNADGANANIYISTDGGTTKTLIPNDLSAVYADWTTKIFDLSAYTDETAVIYFVSNFTTANKYAYLDDVEIVARPCEMILNVQAAPITGGANISWSGNVKKLQYKTGSDAWSSVTIASGDYAGPKQITGLTPARTYQVRLLPACSAEEEANWTTPIIFATSAIESVPYYNNFENEAEGELPFNWSRISVTGYPQISYDSYAYHENFGEKGHSIKFYGVNDQIIVLPEFNMALENLLVSFHYRNRDCRMELGYVEEDGSTFVALETLPNQTGYGEFPYEKVLASISASASKLAIRYSDATGSSSMAFVDNVSVFVPTCAQPVAVTLGTVTHNSAYLSWEASELDTETSYQYICRPWTNADPNWNSAVTLGAGVHELNLTGLSANTSYEFYIRSYCGVSDQSTPISMEFKTALRHEVFEDSQSATNNESRLAALEGQTINVTFNRALQRNGDYSTISLPFNLSATQIANSECPLHGFVIREYKESEVNSEEVNIFLEQVFSIEAGKAYFVRYAGEPTDEPLQPLNFNNVTITASQPTYEVDGNLTLHGLFNPLAVTANDETTLFLGGGNLLYYPSVDGFIKGFRAYFKVDGGGPIAHAIRRGTPIRISEGKNTPTEIEQLQNNDTVVKVIEQGHVIIIRNGQKYNVQGQLIH